MAAVSRSTLVAAFPLALALLTPVSAAGWTFREHEEIGVVAYAAACSALAAKLSGTGDTARDERFTIACRNVDVMALLYGKANGTAGDRISDPEEFRSSIGAFRATSRVHYLRLKLVNSAHFHPKAVTQWREFHRAAIDRAVAASKLAGVDQMAAFELAFHDNAFADHFLQDSFCSGHMGFNRPGSSVSASLVFHDTWNARGRTVRNRLGESWRTYGDTHLRLPKNAEGRRRVIEATRMSIGSVISAFVVGERSPAAEVAVWRALPFSIEAPEMRSPLEELLADAADRPESTGLEPLAAINQPARRGLSLEAWSFATGVAARRRPLLGVLAGFATPVPYYSLLFYGGAGASYAEAPTRPRLTLEAGALRPVAITNDGVISHDVIASVNHRTGLELTRTSIVAGYRATAELGRTLVRVQIGPAYQLSQERWGFYLGLGLGYLWNARGGGSI